MVDALAPFQPEKVDSQGDMLTAEITFKRKKLSYAMMLSCTRDTVWLMWKWPYSVSIRTSGIIGEYIKFLDQNAHNACGKAIEAAIKARA